MPPRKRKATPVERDTDEELDAQLVENVPDTFDPGYEGHMLRIAGVPWAEIAEKIGSPNARAAVRTVSSYLQEVAASQSSQQQQEALLLQLDRYESLLQSWWGPATTGMDEKAAGVVLRVLDSINKLNRLGDTDVVVTKETLVISADPEQYAKQLQSVVRDREDGRK